MKTQVSNTSKSSEMGSKSLTLRKVTPEATRSLVNMGVDFSLLGDNEKPLPFADIEKMPQRSLMPRLQAERRAADLLRSLPPRKISLRKRTSAASNMTTTRPIFYENVLPLPMQESITNEKHHHQVHLLTPKQENAIKRRRLSPPALLDNYDTREPLHLPAAQEDVPSKLMLPSI